MARTVEEIKASLEEVTVELETLVELDNDDSGDRVVELNAKVKEFEAELESAEAYAKARAEVIARRTKDKDTPGVQGVVVNDSVKLPRVLSGQKSRHFASAEDAYLASRYLAYINGDTKAGEILAAQSVGTDAKGGFTVPAPLANTLINLLETRGIARQKCRRIVMTALTQDIPKLTAHATVYYPAEAAAITESDVTFAQINLTAKKIAALVKMSSEVGEDSVISIMDTVVESIAYSVATAEDTNLFLGVSGGVNTTGIEGDSNVSDTNVASVAALGLDDLTACTVSIGNPIVGAVNEWYMNPTLLHGPIRDLLNAAGGNTIANLEGAQRPMLLGYPVNFVNVMSGSTASTAGDLLAVFGDLGIGCYLGDRRQWSFKVLNELYAENDQVGVIGTERIDLKVANPEVLGKITITG